MTPRYFCTYFDHNYLFKGLALYRSLCEHAEDFVLWVLCLDSETRNILTQIDVPNMRTAELRELEAWEPRLAAARTDRTLAEYYWTCTPTWLAYLMARLLPGEVMTYVDADLFFFDSPLPIFEEMGNSAILIHEHRFAVQHQELAQMSGIYNVGLISFRNEPLGWQALRWWQAACLEACYVRPDQGYYGDQKYLDDWPQRFEGVHVLQHVGAGLAPWNAERYAYQRREGRLNVNGVPLIFFHFHGFRQAARRLYVQRAYKIPDLVRRYAYWPYIRSLEAGRREVRAVNPRFEATLARPTWTGLARDIARGGAFWNWQ